MASGSEGLTQRGNRGERGEGQEGERDRERMGEKRSGRGYEKREVGKRRDIPGNQTTVELSATYWSAYRES